MRGAFAPMGTSMDLCPDYQALKGHMGLPDLGLSQKWELRPALKGIP